MWYEAKDSGLTLQIKVFPKSPYACVGPVDADRLQVRVRAAAEDGQANEAVIAALARAFNVPKKSVRILSGQTARTKAVRIEGSSVDPLRFEKEEVHVKAH